MMTIRELKESNQQLSRENSWLRTENYDLKKILTKVRAEKEQILAEFTNYKTVLEAKKEVES